MEVEEQTSLPTDQFIVPFFPHSVNVVCSATNSGKTTLLINILKNQHLCFVRPIEKAVIILCNPKVNGEPYLRLANDHFQIEVIYLNEFEPLEHLSANAVVIFEDVSKLSQDILDCINVFAHHLNLASLFIVCQTIFAEDDFKLLLSLTHRIIIFFGGTGGTKLAQHIRQFFFVNSELKEYFKTIISYAERNKNIVLFELNEIARKDKPNFLAISGFDSYFDEDESSESSTGSVKKPTVVFPHLHKQNMYETMFEDNQSEMEGIDPSTLPRGSYMLVKAENVTSKKLKTKLSDSNETDCEKDWKSLNDNIIEDIESGLKYDKQQKAKNIAKYMLKSKHFCFLKDGKSVMIKDQPKTDSALLDYLSTAIRSSGPNEIPNPKYLLFTRFLLMSKTPECFFKNRALLNGALNGKPLPSFSSLRTLKPKPTAKPKPPAKPKKKKKNNQS
jgi:hypothetical protein